MQNHLNRKDTINLGSFYTPNFIVKIVYEMLKNVVNLKEYLLFDSSCGYGDFFISDELISNYLGADIDEVAIQKVNKNIKVFATNSLLNVRREKFEIAPKQKLIIIGNPPYNDKTSIIRNNIKKDIFAIDKNLAFRDLGISFLRSYAVLNADFVCVLHPLSYLIKKANFNALNAFKDNYILIDNLIISSQIFTPNSNTFFPIIIALYKKSISGMNYEFIQNYTFKTIEGQSFKLTNFDFITNYVSKYSNPYDKRKEVAFFHTLRDINALKRNQTFMKKQTTNSIRVFAENLKYYCYIHHFKQFANKLPYYFGNLDIFIDNVEFLKIADLFLDLKPHPKIKEYFEKLFMEKINISV